MKELVSIKSNLTQKMNRLDLFSNELPNKISCIPEFFIDESDLYNQLSKSYFHRINYKASVDTAPKTALPKCSEFVPLDFSVGLFEHLEAMRKRHKLKMEPEDSFGSKELGNDGQSCPCAINYHSRNCFAGVSTSNFPYVLYNSLRNNPNSWKTHLLSSFYWRFKGNPKEAIGEWQNAFLVISFRLSIEICFPFRMRSSGDTLSTSKIQR